MRQAFVIAGFMLATSLPASAQDCADPEVGCGGIGGVMSELMERIDPFLGSLSELLGDYSGWHMPEVLPNGDILIRRRDDDPLTEDGEDDDSPVLEPLEL